MRPNPYARVMATVREVNTEKLRAAAFMAHAALSRGRFTEPLEAAEYSADAYHLHDDDHAALVGTVFGLEREPALEALRALWTRPA